MPTPEFVSQLRHFVGSHPLPLTAACGVVLDEQKRILLVRRSDDGQWTLPGGIVERGEEPADALVREVIEETGVLVEPELLTSVSVHRNVVTYVNGDQVQYLDMTFRCRMTGGQARVGDDESVEVGWFPVDDPRLHAHCRPLLDAALRCTGAAMFARAGKYGNRRDASAAQR
jgi:8-oxo-dGTP pyrophosphatase MutT (NUDIX family)